MSNPYLLGETLRIHRRNSTRRSQLEDSLSLAEQYQSSLGDLGAWIELYDEGEDVTADLQKGLSNLEKSLSETELQTLLSGPHDRNPSIVTIHPGAGGTESQDWAEMLLRMYLRWAERRGYRTEITDYQAGEEAGLKSVTFLVEGEFAYGYLAAEIGVHRLGAYFPLRRCWEAAHFICFSIRHPRGRGRGGRSDRRKGSQDRYLSIIRRGWTTCQRDRLSGSHYPSSQRDCRAVSE